MNDSHGKGGEAGGSDAGAPPPDCLDATGGVLDGVQLDVHGACFVVRAYQGMVEGDFITLRFDVRGPNEASAEFNVTEGWAGKDIVLWVPKDAVAAAAGCHVDVDYVIQPGSGGTIRNSAPLKLSIGKRRRHYRSTTMYLDQDSGSRRDAAATLEEPTVEESVGNKLDPTLDQGTVVVPLYAGKAPNDVVTMYWVGKDPASSTNDSFRVTSTNQGRVIRFYVDGQYIAANNRTTVEVYYEAARANGSNDGSIHIMLEVGEQAGEPGLVDPPAVEGVQNGVLNLENVPAGGAPATVAAYEGMAHYDVVFIDINGGEWEDGKQIATQAEIGQPVAFTIPREVLAMFSGREVSMRTTVIPASGGDSIRSNEVKFRILEPVGALPEVIVPLADGDALDPEQVVTPTVEVVVKPYQGIAEGDVITFTWRNTSGTPAPFTDVKTVGAIPQQDYVFEVPRAHVDQNIDKWAILSYTVVRGGAPAKPSGDLTLYIGAPFEAAATLDATGKDYIVAEKPPLVVPDFGSYTREAKFGTEPYTYATDDASIATVDNTGRVVATGNGTATISATDSLGVGRSYPITVKGVKQLFFVSASANFAGAQAACAAAGLRTVTLDEMKSFWRGYFPSTGPVAGYMGWLGYLFWTGTQIGAGTAYAYDLNGASEQGNAIGRNEADFLQVVGIAP
ncbi:Ig-like domain-containing protein [Burkholderia humptydooensis]|uniref:Ig-like domain-containing protein n=2 Tax=Burkholderia humptydooensis TaxID=430531 RepID=A0A7T2U8S3_9BURK|nr:MULTISPECIES: Ig-like domain-containing protein [Burkholderia]QPS47777.1 Ig-like domain-containing protein [Burkholderia humptydooensis]